MKYNRDKYLRRKYGISLKKYNSMLKTQKYRCGICGKHQRDEKKALAVDHDHKMTGAKAVRGLLCNYCNSRILKYLGDDKKRAQGLVKYLQCWLRKSKDE